MSVREEIRNEEAGLGTLLEVLHGAGSFVTVRVTFRVWRRTERAQGAFHPAAEEDRRRGASTQTVTLRGRGGSLPNGVETFRIWRSGHRVREEQHGGMRDGYYGVRDGEVWSSWDERTGAVSNQDDPNVGSGIGEQLSSCSIRRRCSVRCGSALSVARKSRGAPRSWRKPFPARLTRGARRGHAHDGERPQERAPFTVLIPDRIPVDGTSIASLSSPPNGHRGRPVSR